MGDPIEAAVASLEAAGINIDRQSDLIPDLDKQHRDYLKMMNTAMARGAPNKEGKRASATDWFNLLDKQARNEAAWAKLFETYDFVLAPPAPILAFEHRDEAVFKGQVDINGEMLPRCRWPRLVWPCDLPQPFRRPSCLSARAKLAARPSPAGCR